MGGARVVKGLAEQRGAGSSEAVGWAEEGMAEVVEEAVATVVEAEVAVEEEGEEGAAAERALGWLE